MKLGLEKFYEKNQVRILFLGKQDEYAFKNGKRILILLLGTATKEKVNKDTELKEVSLSLSKEDSME